MRLRSSLTALAASTLIMIGGVSAAASGNEPPPGLDAYFEEDAVEVQLSRETRPSERTRGAESEEGATEEIQTPGARRIPDNPVTFPRDPGSEPPAGNAEGTEATNPLPPGEDGATASYCRAITWTVDEACQAIINLTASSEPCAVTSEVARSQGQSSLAPVCFDETPEPIAEGPVIEEAVEFAEETGESDGEPDISVIIEQIPGLVSEEFTTLPIDGGSVQFEEDLLGFGFINRHTNVFADVEDQSFQRDMLGIDVEIRAVPVDYHFDYGDGATRTTASPGSSTADQAASGSALTDVETPTSHVYQETGLYDVDLTTTFTGEYRIAGGTWTPIADSTTVAASPGQADIWRTQARHVSGQCEDHAQWGCNGPFTIEGDDRPPEVFADQYDDAGNWRGP
ncbi:hypothetical protein GCM10023354_07000 [Garicola koreensis]